MEELYRKVPDLTEWDYNRDGILLHKFYFTLDLTSDRYYTSDIDIIDINGWSVPQIAKCINEIVDSAKQTYARAKNIIPYYSGNTDPTTGFFLFLTAIV